MPTALLGSNCFPNFSLRRHLMKTSLLFVLGTLTFIPMPGRAAASLILECKTKGISPPWHNLFEVNYDAHTVRASFVTDDGAPALYPNGSRMEERTYSAQISDKEIKWAFINNTQRIYYTLGRYSGTLTVVMNLAMDDGRWRDPVPARSECKPYAPSRQRKF